MVNLSRRRLFDQYDALAAQDPAFAAQIEVERQREIKYEAMKGEAPARGAGGPRRDGDRRPGDRDRRDRDRRPPR